MRFFGILLSIFILNQTAIAETPVNTMIVLAVDVSGSIDDNEYRLQKNGIISALLDKNLALLLKDCNSMGVAITYVEWAGNFDSSKQVHQFVEWTHVKNGQDLSEFALAVDGTSRLNTTGSTDIDLALRFSEKLLKNSTFQSDQKVILVSSDGSQNISQGYLFSSLVKDSRREQVSSSNLVQIVASTSQRLVNEGYLIDALVIMNDEESLGLGLPLDEYYRRFVAGGANSFVRGIAKFDDYKMGLLEILMRIANQCYA